MEIENKNTFPQTPHLAVLIFKSRSIWHEGDERSRQCPGHGYPAYSETINTIKYKVFKDKLEMEKWVLETEAKREKVVYQLIEARPLTATLKASVNIG